MTLRIFADQGPGRGDFAVRRAPTAEGVTVAVGAASAASAALPKNSIVVTLQADEDCHIRFTDGASEGFTPAAATTACYKLSAGVAEDFAVGFGGFKKVTVIGAAA